ncbi:putative Rab proteins geranylgeranyltransferase component A [Ixodes scapularis]
MDDLPVDHDVIVVGTGMPESIIAAAIARIGQRVLHLDKEAHYGSLWASYNFTSLREWMFNRRIPLEEETDASSFDALLHAGESYVLTARNYPVISNAKEIVNVPESIPDRQAPSPCPEQPEAAADVNPAVGEALVSASAESSSTDFESCPCPELISAHECPRPVADVSGADDVGNGTPVPTSSDENGSRPTVADPAEVSGSDNSSLDATFGSVTQRGESSLESDGASGSAQNKVQVKEEWSLAKMIGLSRKFNLDLAPKLLFSRGPLVELLISSNIARYAEFKAVTRILTHHDGTLQQVPCSRADVFSCKHVTVIEKRMLMKFLTFCKEFQQHPEEYRGFEGKPFREFLSTRQLTQNLEHYILHAIAMVDDQTPTLQGLKSTQKFLESLGRYGNSPFLASLYGSGELPQCFCRLCAVYGGIYHLQRGPGAIVRNEQGACVGIISNGRRFNCKWLVMESSYAPQEFKPTEGFHRVSRAILVTDRSLLPAEKEQITLLRVPRKDGVGSAVLVQEMGPGMMVCPAGLFVVHLTCPSVGEDAEEDLEPVVRLLFSLSSDESEEETRPRALYLVYFNSEDTTGSPLNRNCPPGLILVSSPGPYLDYERPVNEAMEVFRTMYADEEFLPRAPDPEEILLEYENNPGDHEPQEDGDHDETASDEKEAGEKDADKDGRGTAEPDTPNQGKPEQANKELEDKEREPESGKGDDSNASKRTESLSSPSNASFSGDS